MKHVIEEKLYNKRRILDKKYKILRDKCTRNPSSIVNEPMILEGFVKNFSTQPITDDELSLLNKGLQFALPPIKPPVEDLCVDIMASVWNLPEEAQDGINHASFNIVKKVMTSKIKTDENVLHLHNVAKGLRLKPVVIAKADKSNNVVILDEKDYEDKVMKLIA